MTRRPFELGGANVPQRGVVEPALNPILLHSAQSIPTSWTTVYTAEKKVRIEWMSFVSQDGTSYVVKARLLSRDGTGIEITRASFTAEGDQWRPMDQQQTAAMEPGWALQLIGSGGGTINVHVYITGIELWYPS